jgi:hypothetical protein
MWNPYSGTRAPDYASQLCVSARQKRNELEDDARSLMQARDEFLVSGNVDSFVV